MKLSKSKLVNLPAVYVTEIVKLRSKYYYLVASEDRGENAYIIDSETLEKKDLWKGDTGVMNIVQIPGREELLCITKFYPIFQSSCAEISLLKPQNEDIFGTWEKEVVLKVPYCHRIGVVKNDEGKLFLISSALCEKKEYETDWRFPGAAYISEIPTKEGEKWELKKFLSPLTKNHGLWIEDGNKCYITAEEGIFKMDFSNYKSGEDVNVEKISSTPTSDISLSPSFYATIEPFHGDTGSLYTKEGKIIKSYPIKFGHAVWTGKLFSQNVVILGERDGEKALKIYNVDTGEEMTIDQGIGPTQITVLDLGSEVRILSANHGAGNVYLYTLTV